MFYGFEFQMIEIRPCLLLNKIINGRAVAGKTSSGLKTLVESEKLCLMFDKRFVN